MAKSQPVSVDVEGTRLSLSNLDKVLYPQTRTTKGEVIDYYARIAPAILPHLAERPVTRKRWPNGVESNPVLREERPGRHPVLGAHPAGRGHGYAGWRPRAADLPVRRRAGHADLAGQPGRPRAARAAVDGRAPRRDPGPGPAGDRPRPGPGRGPGRMRRGRPRRARPARDRRPDRPSGDQRQQGHAAVRRGLGQARTPGSCGPTRNRWPNSWPGRCRIWWSPG